MLAFVGYLCDECRIRVSQFSCNFVNVSSSSNAFDMAYLYTLGLKYTASVFTLDAANNVKNWPGRVAQSVTCLATDTSLTADPGAASSIPTRALTCVEINYEIISTVILLPSAESFKKGCCQLQAKVCAQITG